MTAGAAQAILFGKLPSHGDFVARGLTHDEQAAWDDALALAMARAQERHGADFPALFGSAAPWRCIVEDGSGWIAGALTPSMDKAGRLFPILLACRLPGPDGGAGVAAACEMLLFEALGAGWTADELAARAGALPIAAAAGPAPVASGWWLDGDELLRDPPPRLAGLLPPDLMSEMLGVIERQS